MWTLAASASAYLQHMREPLYDTARARLDKLESQLLDVNAASSLQQAQALLLLSNYEFRYLSHDRAWSTAGRAFRIVLMAYFHQMDRFDVSSPTSKTWIDTEEARRTFWLAYCLDRFANLEDGKRLTLHEDSVSIRPFHGFSSPRFLQ